LREKEKEGKESRDKETKDKEPKDRTEKDKEKSSKRAKKSEEIRRHEVIFYRSESKGGDLRFLFSKENLHGAYEDYSFFYRIKQKINNPDIYNEFLKCLNLYTLEIFTKVMVFPEQAITY